MITFTPAEKEIIYAAQLEQIKKPARVCVNTEAAFVKDRIGRIDQDLASRYWSAVCLRQSLGHDSLNDNQVTLSTIDKEFKMPAWGTRGT